MDAALYEPGLGYYARAESPIGLNRDFFTSVSATGLFGRLLATVLREYRDATNPPEPFCVYEFGAHTGSLGRDIQLAAPELEYRTFEQPDVLPESMRGCVLSNELLDAMPVHRLKVCGGKWKEYYVAVAPGTGCLEWLLAEPSDPRLLTRLAGLPVEWMEGYETEVCLQAEDWLRSVALRLEAGFIVTIDYGFDTPEYFSPRRVRGGLRCYHRHQTNTSPLERLGEQDITADVNFGALMAVGEQCGLETIDFLEQGRFFWKRCQALLSTIIERDAGQMSRDRNAIHLLTHPAMMGAPFKVLVQRKRT
jgi:SAM-dependent MidA family methyltransferase